MSTAARLQLAQKELVPSRPPSVEPCLKLMCPECSAELGAIPRAALSLHCEFLRCSRCSFELRQERCIWGALPQRRQKYFERFMREYETVRASEGRGSTSPAYYLALPHQDFTRRHSWQWKIYSRSFRYIERRVLPEIERRMSSPLSILDLGAGNGWLSYRLTLRGHSPVAVDLLTNAFDGLGAASHYLAVLPSLFPRFRAEFDRLPFSSDQFDCVIFNDSFHYSENYTRTLGEAVRCLRNGGGIIIADSPWYSREEYGQMVIQKRQKDFQEKFSFPSASLASCEYLTDERLTALEVKFDFDWKIQEPWYGIRWAARPWIAKWKGGHEPAQFRIYSAEVNSK